MGSVAEVGEAFDEVVFCHFVVEVEAAGGGGSGLSEDASAGGDCCDDGEGDGGFAGFGWGVEGDGSAFGDDGFGEPFFVWSVVGPEFVPVDQVGEFDAVGGFDGGDGGCDELCFEIVFGGAGGDVVEVGGCC